MKIKSINKFVVIALLLCAAMACSSSVNTNSTINANVTNVNVNATVDSNNSNVAVESVPPSGMSGQTISPEMLVADLYKQHDAKKSPFFQTKSRALVDKYFTKATADLIWKDATTSKGEVGALDGDPLYDAQDIEIKNFKVGPGVIKDKSATVAVTFENLGKKTAINYALVQENGVWKIEDIKYDGNYTLVKLLKDDSSGNSKDAQNSSEKNFEGKYHVGETSCTVKPIKMAFEVKWEKGAGTEIFFFKDQINGKYVFTSESKAGAEADKFSFDDENYNSGTFHRADGKEFAVSRAK